MVVGGQAGGRCRSGSRRLARRRMTFCHKVVVHRSLPTTQDVDTFWSPVVRRSMRRIILKGKGKCIKGIALI